MAGDDDTPLFHELEPPPDVREKGGHEVLRASVVEGAVSLTLRRSFDDPHTWGVLLADLARQVSHVYAAETGMSAEEAFAQIRAGLDAEFDTPGSPHAVN
ncbi:DUF5076 domain-containing protein [Salinarimonas chemoclinalis]|uniref:DUF5076 domain-containing protein n=1 Tax=Salinarimonas chemoclinalis TaxID=3241599 RepID=UPI00355612A4